MMSFKYLFAAIAISFAAAACGGVEGDEMFDELDTTEQSVSKSGWQNCVRAAAGAGMDIDDIHKKCDPLYKCEWDNSTGKCNGA